MHEQYSNLEEVSCETDTDTCMTNIPTSRKLVVVQWLSESLCTTNIPTLRKLFTVQRFPWLIHAWSIFQPWETIWIKCDFKYQLWDQYWHMHDQYSSLEEESESIVTSIPVVRLILIHAWPIFQPWGRNASSIRFNSIFLFIIIISFMCFI